MAVQIIKASGETEYFDLLKVRRACLRAGASLKIADSITAEINHFIYDGISTIEIYRAVGQLLEKHTYNSSVKYRLKEAIMNMGPSGFPFETYISEIFRHYGYRTKTRVVLRGACVNHEIDIIIEKGAPKETRRIIVECKYHNSSGIYTGLKEVLYTYARLLDLKEAYDKGVCDKIDEAWLITNTKISQDAQEYSKCKGLRVIGWRYPYENGLEKMIEEKNLYPITILKSIDRNTLSKFSKAEIMLLRNLQKLNIKTLSDKTNIPYSKLEKIKIDLQRMT